MSDRLKVRGTLAKFNLKPKTNDEDGPLAADFLKKLVEIGRRTGGEEPQPTPQSVVFIEDIQRRTGVEILAEMAARKADIDAAADAWPKLADLGDTRLAAWNDLHKLFDHAKSEPGAAAINADIEAIRTGRLLLESSDPLPPIRAKIAEILRRRLKETHEDHRQTFDREVKQLAASSVWSQLAPDKQAAILAEVGLREPDAVDVSTDATIAAALAERPIDSRRNAALAVPTLAGQALRKAAAAVEPTARSIAVEKTTLRDADEVREWAKRAESHLLEEVKKGPVLVS
jgi:CRP-like cAMP-binding protein